MSLFLSLIHIYFKNTVGAHAVARAAGDAQGVVDLNGVIALVIDVSGDRQRLARAVVHAVAAALAARCV